MKKQSILIQQLDNKISSFVVAEKVLPPPTGWIKAIRTAIRMSMQQLGDKLSLTRQSILALEKREKEGSITLNSLKEVANAMDMKLVYAIVPKDGTLDALIERKALELAKQIVMRTSNTMKLEDQENTEKRIEQAIKERAMEIKFQMPKILWD